jgi:hypothetical protein
LNDTNRHPLSPQEFRAGDVPYRLMRPGFESSDWGTWHGFSFNPGLRRRKDMSLVGRFAALAASAGTPSWEVERAASRFYLQRGFLAAALASNSGKGYVSHIGWDRRVSETGVK